MNNPTAAIICHHGHNHCHNFYHFSFPVDPIVALPFFSSFIFITSCLCC